MTGLRVMTWNVENLFRPGVAAGGTQAEYDAKLASLAAVVTAQAPDVLVSKNSGPLRPSLTC